MPIESTRDRYKRTAMEQLRKQHGGEYAAIDSQWGHLHQHLPA